MKISLSRSHAGILAGLSFGLAAACLAAAPRPSVPEKVLAVDRTLISEERSSSEVVDNLEYLSDIIGPRLTGSENLRRANDWTAEKMKQYGLENVHLEPYTIPRGWERGPVVARIVEPNGAWISAAQMAWTPGTRGTVVGPVVMFNPTSEADLAQYAGKLHGAIVLSGRISDRLGGGGGGMMDIPSEKAPPPIPALSSPSTAQAQPEEQGPPRQQGGPQGNFQRFRELQQKINAFLQKEGAAVIMRDAAKPYDLLNMTGSWTSNSPFTTLFIAHADALMLKRQIEHGAHVTMSVKADGRFTRGPITVYNTVGEIRGSEKPNEVVLIGGHLDSWDLGTGSTDNGTGSMAALEAARLLKASGVTPARTIRCVMFTGEEEGLMGSKAYVDAHKQDMTNYDVVFVHDTGTGRVKGLWLQDRAEDKPVLDEQFAALNDLGLLTDTPTLLPGKMNGTDHASFDNAGVPAFAFNQESADYGLTHHSQADTFDMIRPDDLKQGACVLAILAYNAAEMPDRYPHSAAGSQSAQGTR